MGSLQARLGDMAAEHPLRHDLRLDRDPLAALCGLASDGEAVMEGVSPAWNRRAEPPRRRARAPTRRARQPKLPARHTCRELTGVATTGQKSPRVRLVLIPPAVNDQSVIRYSRAMRQARNSSRRRAIRSTPLVVPAHRGVMGDR